MHPPSSKTLACIFIVPIALFGCATAEITVDPPAEEFPEISFVGIVRGAVSTSSTSSIVSGGPGTYGGNTVVLSGVPIYLPPINSWAPRISFQRSSKGFVIYNIEATYPTNMSVTAPSWNDIPVGACVELRTRVKESARNSFARGDAVIVPSQRCK